MRAPLAPTASVAKADRCASLPGETWRQAASASTKSRAANQVRNAARIRLRRIRAGRRSAWRSGVHQGEVIAKSRPDARSRPSRNGQRLPESGSSRQSLPGSGSDARGVSLRFRFHPRQPGARRGRPQTSPMPGSVACLNPPSTAPPPHPHAGNRAADAIVAGIRDAAPALGACRPPCQCRTLFREGDRLNAP